MASLVHLGRRFFGSLSPRRLDPDDDRWVASLLGDGERALWDRMSLADRKHAAGVAREVQRLLPDADRAVLAAALLHDVGKIEAGLGTPARVAATVVGLAGRERAAGWANQDGPAGRVGRYLCHDVIGARLLSEAGADPLTVTWAREHHLAREAWTLPAEIAGALAAADDD